MLLTPAFNRGKSTHGIIIHPTGDVGGAIRDESPYARTVTAYGGGAVIASGPFGLALKCRNATSDYYSIAYSADAHNLGANDFSLRFRINFYDAAYRTFFLCQWGGASDFFYVGKDSAANGNKIEIRAFLGGADRMSYLSGNLSFNNSIDYYIETVRSGSNVYLFINGVSQGLNTVVPVGATSISISGNWEINLCRNDTRYGDYKISEISLLKGFASHTSDYTPPTRRL